MSTLSVEISSRTSSSATVSPTCLAHRKIVPSVTVSPNWGMLTVVDILGLLSVQTLAGRRQQGLTNCF